jgi:hypothetical protein
VSPGTFETGFILDPSVIEAVPALVFSQPMSTADLVLASADDRLRERTKPAFSGKLATMGYLFPSLRRTLLPALERKGRAAKKKYLARNAR